MGLGRAVGGGIIKDKARRHDEFLERGKELANPLLYTAKNKLITLQTKPTKSATLIRNTTRINAGDRPRLTHPADTVSTPVRDPDFPYLYFIFFLFFP